MLASILARHLRQLAAAQPQQHLVQQVRFARKVPNFYKGYGEPPLITEDDFIKAQEEDRLKDMSFREVRFATPYETCSPLYDKFYTKFITYVMQGGKKALADRIMHETLYEIKRIQYMRKRKLESKSVETVKKPASKDTLQEEDGDDEKQVELDPIVILKEAVKNCEPVVVTRKVKRGGATYQVPFPLMASQSEWFSIRWLMEAVRDRPKPRTKHFHEVMAQEMLDAYYMRGKVIKRKDDMHKLADANKAYAHYRWG